MGIFGGAKTPTPPPPPPLPPAPPPPPTPADPAVVQARSETRARLARSQGRGATILTSPGGLLDPLTDTKKKLLGS